jgi:V8-like Glu-specific endopeptidase
MKPCRSTIALAFLLLCSGGQLTAQAQDLDNKTFFAERRAAFERTGEAPTVPPSLSADPADPEYVFLGYMPIATPEQEKAHFARLRTQRPKPASAAEKKALNTQLAEQEIAGVFVNEAGEKWAFKPRDLADRLHALRLIRGGSTLRNADGHQGVGPVETGELETALPEGMSRITAESVLGGSDNRILRSTDNGFNMKAYPWRALGVLVPNAANTANVPPVVCSATKIGERHLLTAAHCVFTEGGGEGSLMTRDWWPGGDGLNKTMNGGDPSPNNYKNIEWYYYDEKYVDDGWDTRDFAVLVLADNQNSCNLGWFGYRVDNSLAGSNMWNFGYPGENQNCSASPRGDDNCGGSMYGMEAKITRTEAPYLFFKHDITGGHSGSAIYDFNGGNRQLVGIVKGDYGALENRGIKIRSLVFDFIDSVRDERPSSFCNP